MNEDSRTSRIAGAAVIVLLTTLAYIPAMTGKFVWDDDSWTTGIEALLRDGHGLWLMWSDPTALQQYYPLTGTSFWIDYHLWGFQTVPYHIENLILHILSALLFWDLLRRLKVPGAWLAGAIFALHPLMVESVAWITERKNVLSMVFYLSTLLAYGRFMRFWKEDSVPANKTSPPQDWWVYGAAFILFAAALAAKATAFSIPAVILLICWWKRGRIRLLEDVLPTLPFFILAIGYCQETAYLEKNSVGAQGSAWDITFLERCLIAGRVVWFYIGKLVLPLNLCFVYPRWHVNAGSWKQWLLPISAVGVLLALWMARKRIGRGPLSAGLFYVGTLFPALGFMNAYFMYYSFVCDHWTYLPSLGLIALAAAGLASMARRWKAPALQWGIGPVLLVVLAIATWRQSAVYADVETLWNDTLAKNPDAWLAHNNLGMILKDRGEYADAMTHFQDSIRGNPDFPQAHNNLGIILKHLGKTDEAIEQYQEALRLKPEFAEAHDNLATAYRAQGKVMQAIEQDEMAVQLKPDLTAAHYNLAIALTQQGNADDAIRQYEIALQLKPDFFEAHCNLGLILMALGRNHEAVEEFNDAIKLRPGSADAHNSLAVALWQAGESRDAMAQWQAALQIVPNYAEAQKGLAQALATLAPTEGGDPGQAVTLAESACDLTDYQVAADVDVLAMAYAAAGRFNDAVPTAQKAIDLAQAARQQQLVSAIQARLRLYRAGRPYQPDPTGSQKP